MIGAVGLSALPAGAVNNDPAGNPTSPAITYEADCSGTGVAAGNVVPFVVSTDIDTTSGVTQLAAGTAFGVAGAVSQTLNGAYIAGSDAAFNPPTYNLTGTMTFGPTDGNSTGSSSYTTPTFADQANPGGQVLHVTYTSGSTTLTGDFSASAPGDFVANSVLGGTGIIPGSVITAITGTTSATINQATTAAAGGAGVDVGYAPEAGLTFTDVGFATSATAFTATGTHGGTAGIGVTSVSVYSVNEGPSIVVTYGGTPGVGATNCLETGWTSGPPAPGPAQVGESTPLTPPGATTPLVTTAPTFQPGAYANLVEPPPTADAQTINLGTGGTKTVTLATTAGNPSFPVTSCAASGVPSDPRLSVTFSGVCSATLVDSGTGAATVTFQFTATDSFPLTSAPGTVTVVIGTQPVDQPLDLTVGGGALVLSCSAPPADSTTCPVINLPAITLNGTQQTTTAAANTLYVSDNRGDPTVGWTVTTYLVPTGSNPNAGCDTSADFCNSNVAADPALPVNHITAGELALSGDACAAMGGNLNPAPAAGPGASYAATQTVCTAAAGTNGGSFTVNGTFTLTVPSSTAAGAYQGTVEYLVA
jgi:hypothetical protein